MCHNYSKPKYDAYYLHRWIMRANENDKVDHIVQISSSDSYILDNRKSNFRFSTGKENSANRNGANRNNNTGVRNVSYIKSDNVYWVQIMKDGIKYKWVFSVDKFEEACAFAEIKRQELFGEFAGNGITQ